MKNDSENYELITVKDSYGIRSCDVKCFDALEPECRCVCRGRNHGVGYKKAIELTIKHQEDYKKMYESYGSYVMFKIMQME